MKEIPKPPVKIQEAIAFKAESVYAITNMGKYLRQAFEKGAEYGYQLAPDGEYWKKRCEAAEDEIKRLLDKDEQQCKVYEELLTKIKK